MKLKIHPQYHPEVKVTCACGNTFTTGSTKASIEVEICSNCHPFFTGKSKLIDTAGRVDRFRARVEKGKKFAEVRKQRETEKRAKVAAEKKVVATQAKVASEILSQEK